MPPRGKPAAPTDFSVGIRAKKQIMNTARLEAFSDGVIAIVITIMVLELKVPHGATWGDISPLWTVFLSYCLSFVYVGIFWNNHHHLLHSASSVTGTILWANLHLLFWLSLMPFATGWMARTISPRCRPRFTAQCSSCRQSRTGCSSSASSRPRANPRN